MTEKHLNFCIYYPMTRKIIVLLSNYYSDFAFLQLFSKLIVENKISQYFRHLYRQ